jgi:hypothetical protein
VVLDSAPDTSRIDPREVELSAYVAIKKSELYSSLWKRSYELRGGMDALQYKGCRHKQQQRRMNTG